MKKIVLWVVLFVFIWLVIDGLVPAGSSGYSAGGAFQCTLIVWGGILCWWLGQTSSSGAYHDSSAKHDEDPYHVPMGCPPRPSEFSGDNNDWVNTVDMIDEEDEGHGR